MLDGDPAELAALYQDLLIRVTDFFRDPESFDALRQSVFPALYKDRPSNRPLRIWVPGCATGEEVYSVAMALLEYLGDPAPAAGVQIFGTDISDAALQKARAGVYAQTELSAVSPERLAALLHRAERRVPRCQGRPQSVPLRASGRHA